MTPEQLQSAVIGFIAGARAKAVGGLTVAEFGSLTVEVIPSPSPTRAALLKAEQAAARMDAALKGATP